MTQDGSNEALTITSSKLINDLKLGLTNSIYQIVIAKDGALWCALIGPNIQEGIGGFGVTVSEALRDLAVQLER